MSVPTALLAGRYRLVSVIATGGMGVVWEGWDERLERSVAIKQLRALPGVTEAEAELAKDRAMREARITARLHHPHAVPVFDTVEHDGQPCLIMQFLPSTPLSAVLRESGPLPLSDVARIGAEVASALTAAHRLGIIHRDVKPGNILITPDGASHISDFGISHAMGDATLTGTGLIHGTLAYLAPEVARGEEASFPSDVFSLGSTLYAALEGAPPFGTDGNSIALLHRVAAASVPAPTRAGSLTSFLMDMLSPEPESRPTMGAVAFSLAELKTDIQPADEEPTVPHAAPPSLSATDLVAGVETTQEFEPEPEAVPAPLGGAARRLPDESRPEPGVTSVTSGGAPPPVRSRRPSPAVVLAGVAVVVALVLLMALALTDQLRRDPEADPRTAGRTPTTTEPSTPASSSESPVVPTTAAEAEPTPAPAPLPEPAVEPEPAPEPTTDPASPDRTTQLVAAISNYYALLPNNTAEAWPWMTADYQANHAGGFSSYEDFWTDIADVDTSDVQATPPDRVVATLTYSYRNGRVDVERTSYRLVDEGGLLKIAASEVLSSRSG